MKNTAENISQFKDISDEILLNTLAELVSRENEITLKLLFHLGEVEARKLYLSAGFSSMFGYATKKLCYSEPAAYRRLSCARALRKFPDLAEQLKSRKLSLTTLAISSRYLTADNYQEIIQNVCGKSKQEVERYLSQHVPRSEAP